ncbi:MULTISPECIES: S-layer homology domain-containing protein [Paenibacillus]|uniref:S-layer homology domain-containing protein n=1 Tax=Paenibacillus TaxID=44249 RepID=UPI001914FB00|nr:S-layer homology domain-containing protein [Paenibacillus sp. EPM92]
MIKKWITVLSATTLLTGALAGSALAFNDVDADQKEPVMDLKARGIVSGVDDKHFVPKGKASYAQSVHMLVKAFGLNIDPLKFVKKPEATDYFKKVPNNAWYAESFVIAHLNGLPIPSDIDPSESITREQFADLLIHAIDTKGAFPVIKMWIQFTDQDDIEPAYNNSLQRMVLHGIVKLGEDRKFFPKQELTRGEAAVWLHKAIRFVETHTKPQAPQEEVSVSVVKVNDDVSKVVLSRGQKPTAGYGIQVTGIRFEGDDRAVVTYTLTDPEPDSLNAAVITEPKAETYVHSKYKVVAEPAAAK